MNKIKYFDPIDFLRVLGTIMVFFLHVSLFSSKLGFQFTNKTWLLQTPAWAGVWIFFIVSGFLIGNGFIEKRYDFSLKGVLKFYCGRLCKIGIPTWLFIFLCLTIIQPEFAIANPEIIWKNLFFIYDSTPGFDGPSAAWYISTLMQLYFIAPFVYKLFDYILEKFNFHLYMSIFLFIVIALLGLFIRLGAYKLNLDWSSKVYVPFYMNLDLFFLRYDIELHYKKYIF